MGPIGRSLRRLEDERLLRGQARFVDDLQPPDLLHVAFARSPIAHGTLTGLDLTASRAAPGVAEVISAEDLQATCLPLAVHLTTRGAVSPPRPVLAEGRVRFAGELLAAVVAGTRYEAVDAAELVRAEIEPLDAVTTYQAAMAAGAPLIHADVPGNVYFLGRRVFGDPASAFAAADLVVEAAVTHPRVAAAPMEGRGAVAQPTGEHGVTLWTSTQVPHLVARAIAECLGLDEGEVRVVAADVGGGFGVKAQVYPEEVVLAWIARRMKRTVKWSESRVEHFLAASHARDQRIEMSAAVRNDGRVLAVRAKVFSSIGAYGIRPFGPLLDPMTCAGLIPGPYDIRDYEYDSYAVATNQSPEGPYRGVGMVTAVLAHERLVDIVAMRLGVDPADVRRVNFVTAGQMPYVAATGHPYESGDYAAALDSALDTFDYRGARDMQARARAQGRLVGVGLCSYVEFTGAGSSTFKGRGMADIPGVDTARVWLDGDGRVRVQTTCPAIGQGSQTTFAQVAAAGLGVDAESIIVEQTDSGKVGAGTGSFMSRGSVTAATSTHRAAMRLREAILNAASWRLDQPVERLSIVDSSVIVDGEPGGVALSELAAIDPVEHGGDPLDCSVTYDAVQASHPYATHACLVEVDAETGAAKILRFVVAEDCGVLINPRIVEGQVTGGVAQGIGAALLEEIVYSADGNLLTSSFVDYQVPSAGEVPPVEITHLVTPSTVHELGTKGVGEGGTIGATAAVANAVADALHLSDLTLPLTPDRLTALIQAKGRVTPQRFDALSYLEWNAARRPAGPALWEAGEEIGFEALLGHVRRFQRLLASRGVGRGDVVAVQLPNVWQYVALELAIPDLGAVILPLPPNLGEHELSWILELTRPRSVIVGTGGGVAAALTAELAWNVDELTAASAEGLPAPAPLAPDPERVVEVALTSGTTGLPKLASLTARLKQATFEAFTERLGITASDRVLPMTPLTQGIGGMCLYCLRAGASLVMLREAHWTPGHCAAAASDSRATLMVGVPTNVIRMLNERVYQATPLDAVRAVAVAGAPLPPEVAQRWEESTGIPISSFYGSMDAGQLAVASPTDPQQARWTTVGRPHDRAEWTIVDGEICMRGDLVQERYWGEDRGPYAPDGWAHMGDLGFVDEDGYLHVVGRIKDIIIRGGTNINPYEVESMLRKHPSVRDVCLVARRHPELGEVPVAFVVGDAGKDEVHSFLRDQGLARHKWPEAVYAVEELPLAGPGKVNRKSLREMADARAK